MSDPFIAEIKIFAGNYAPRGWAFCNGQLLPTAQNTALFALVGTTYGGDGRVTFGVPNLQGRAPMHPGRGPGLTDRRLGEAGGVETVTLSQAQMPSHNQAIQAIDSPADDDDPGPNKSLARSVEAAVYGPASSLVPMASQSLPNAGGNGPHNNMQPYLTLNFIIALVGIFPART